MARQKWQQTKAGEVIGCGSPTTRVVKFKFRRLSPRLILTDHKPQLGGAAIPGRALDIIDKRRAWSVGCYLEGGSLASDEMDLKYSKWLYLGDTALSYAFHVYLGTPCNFENYKSPARWRTNMI
jgi:hypothetical protein